jgi:hypothetical protein
MIFKYFESLFQTKWNWTLILTFLGVIAAWVPFLYERLVSTSIEGKIISQYDNLGTFQGKPATMFIFKLGVIAINKSYNVKDIDVDIQYEKYGWTHNTSVSQRETFFTLDNKVKRLTVPQQEFLNNLTILKKDEPVVGYIFVATPLINEKIVEVKFIFNSFSGKKKVLSFNQNNIDSTKLFYDDSIWQPMSYIH